METEHETITGREDESELENCAICGEESSELDVEGFCPRCQEEAEFRDEE